MAIDIKSVRPVRESSNDWFAQLSVHKVKISSEERMFFTERVALLLETGGTLLQSLQAMKLQTDNPDLAAIIGDLADSVESGKSFSQALAKHPEIFSSTYVSLINASEHGGFMPQVLQQLMQMEEKREKLRATLKTAFIYPAFLLFFSLFVTVFILLVIFPKFSVLFASIHDQLPFTTLILMAMSDILRHYWLIVLIGIAGISAGISKWIKSPGGKEILDNFKLKTPLLKDLTIEVYLVQVLRVMSLSLLNGVSLLEALQSCHDVVNNFIFRHFMDNIEKQVIEGQGIAVSFENEEIIPPLASQMIRTGEESGNLALVMERVAEFYERRIEKKITLFSKMIEPVMLLVMGVVIGLMVSSIILPIFKLSTAVH